jgi:hypothetical protein
VVTILTQLGNTKTVGESKTLSIDVRSRRGSDRIAVDLLARINITHAEI